MKKSMVSDPRFLEAEVALDKAVSTTVHITDPIAREAIENVTAAVRHLRAVLADWEADENDWKRPGEN